ncbi:hypothetical protein [Methylocaldum sp.]|uniref:hypothetical protein n=1 Tax=Methylocaldum sp. TaxID=1969727 RepID=UPI002D792B39|nr:hypothetical protein [Methylocaldum sp.]
MPCTLRVLRAGRPFDYAQDRLALGPLATLLKHVLSMTGGVVATQAACEQSGYWPRLPPWNIRTDGIVATSARGKWIKI